MRYQGSPAMSLRYGRNYSRELSTAKGIGKAAITGFADQMAANRVLRRAGRQPAVACSEKRDGCLRATQPASLAAASLQLGNRHPRRRCSSVAQKSWAAAGG